MPIGLGTAALIGGAISAGTSLLGTHFRNEAQKRENQMAFERERQQIREQNAYNSPSAQMARMAAAGLNPNLMYDNGEAGLQTEIPRYSPAELESGVEKLGNIGSQVISDIIGLKDLENKTALTGADIALKDMQAFNQYTSGELNSTQKQALLQTMGFADERFPYELARLQWQAENEKLGHEKLKVDIEAVKKSWDLTDAQIRELASRSHVNEAQALEILTLLEPRKQEILQHIRTMVTEGKLNMANVQVAFQNSEYLRALTWEVGQRYFLDEWKAQQDILQRGAALENDSARIELESSRLAHDKAHDWAAFGTDTFFRLAEVVVNFLPYILKGPKIGFK